MKSKTEAQPKVPRYINKYTFLNHSLSIFTRLKYKGNYGQGMPICMFSMSCMSACHTIWNPECPELSFQYPPS